MCRYNFGGCLVLPSHDDFRLVVVQTRGGARIFLEVRTIRFDCNYCITTDLFAGKTRKGGRNPGVLDVPE